jgi:hypothetical protein
MARFLVYARVHYILKSGTKNLATVERTDHPPTPSFVRYMPVYKEAEVDF